MHLRLSNPPGSRHGLTPAGPLIRAAAIAAACLAGSALLSAHGGAPPFQVLADRVTGAYKISVWADPDTTADGSAGGQFWVTLAPAGEAPAIPDGTRVTVSIAPADDARAERAGVAEPVDGNVARQYVALPMAREGRFLVHVAVAGPLGEAGTDTEVAATYDERPSGVILALFIAPFLIVGFFGVQVILRRRKPQSHS
jgi:hypothetical protein